MLRNIIIDLYLHHILIYWSFVKFQGIKSSWFEYNRRRCSCSCFYFPQTLHDQFSSNRSHSGTQLYPRPNHYSTKRLKCWSQSLVRWWTIRNMISCMWNNFEQKFPHYDTKYRKKNKRKYCFSPNMSTAKYLKLKQKEEMKEFFLISWSSPLDFDIKQATRLRDE